MDYKMKYSLLKDGVYMKEKNKKMIVVVTSLLLAVGVFLAYFIVPILSSDEGALDLTYQVSQKAGELMKKNYILSVVAVLLIVGISFTFAYFMSGVRVDGDGSDVTVTPGDNMIEVEYDAGSEVVDVDGVVPGDIVTKEFDIIIRPTEIEKEATYAIKLDIDSWTYVKFLDTFLWTNC